ncbi:MAG: hypothetical protein HY537_01500 [Deltaproteobacteria bacterium]|nr:hypothetical protein [Deltaproteobacteria bacterium]
MGKILILCLIVVSQALAVSQYKHAIVGYPKNDDGCTKTSEQIGNLFQTATGVVLVTARCKQDTHLGYDIEIIYRADTPVRLSTNDTWPIYKSPEACNASLPGEKELFENVTALRPYLSFCRKYSWSPEASTRYTPWVEAVGSPQAFIRSYSISMLDGEFSGETSVYKDIIAKSNSAGIGVIDAAIDGRVHESDLWIRFKLSPEEKFDPDRLFLLKERMGGVFFSAGELPEIRSYEQCHEQQKEARVIFDSHFTGPVVWFCMRDPYLFRTKLYHLRIKPGPESFEGVVPGDDEEPFLNEYPSREACEHDKDTVVSHYKKKLDDIVLGAMCSWPLYQADPTPIRMKIYTLVQ